MRVEMKTLTSNAEPATMASNVRCGDVGQPSHPPRPVVNSVMYSHGSMGYYLRSILKSPLKPGRCNFAGELRAPGVDVEVPLCGVDESCIACDDRSRLRPQLHQSPPLSPQLMHVRLGARMCENVPHAKSLLVKHRPPPPPHDLTPAALAHKAEMLAI